MTVSEDVAKIARRIDVATGKAPADLVIRNANVVNVFLRKVELCDVAVADGCIAGGVSRSEKMPGLKRQKTL